MRIIGTMVFDSYWPSNIAGLPENNLTYINL